MARWLPYLFLIACPLAMMFMMRGMHGGHQMGGNATHAVDSDPRDARTAALEAEIAQLRAERTANRNGAA